MSTTSTQELINTAVSSALANSDDVAKLYLRLRQDVLHTYMQTQKEVAAGGVSAESMRRLAQLRVDHAQMVVAYSAHIDRQMADDAFGVLDTLHTIEHAYDALETEKNAAEAEISRLQHTQGPVLKRMHRLVDNYTQLLARGSEGRTKREKDAGSVKDLVSKELSVKELSVKELSVNGLDVNEIGAKDGDGAAAGEDDHLDDCRVFTKEELRTSLADMGSRFADFGANAGLTPREMLDIDLDCLLDRLLSENKILRRLPDGSYQYRQADAKGGRGKDFGDCNAPVIELELAIESLSGEVLAVAEETKRLNLSWKQNAQLLELLGLPGGDPMDVDSGARV
ncbi:hypothetical protein METBISCDRAFT_27170 [Metschnikowia bicuspidata]|uniref:Uncharacterized protein n=1 Tax=Metschnikowia bicuspidata TaxID=27322 RepID=A0A4P9ZDG4_9ASCO|nr:hypothetical protein METBISCDRAFT_27170 [Metschnikowia bicuspidata]